MKNENNENENIDNWMPKTSKKEMALVILLSPFIALGGWVFLLILCMKEGN